MTSIQRWLVWGILGTLFLVNVLIWQSVVAAESSEGLTVAFLDVGQGDATFIEGPNGNQVLIDGGAGGAVLRELAAVLPALDRSIDVVIATHPDQDHIGGVVEVLERFDVEWVVRSGATNDTGVYQALNEIVKSRGVGELIARRGMVIDLGSGAYLRVLFPDRDVSRVNPNDASIVTQLIYGDIEFMFTGDASKSIEMYLTSLDNTELESEILKVGHHGSRTSSAETFVGFVSPEFAVVSAGENNRYGHPHPDVLSVFEQFEVPVLGTYEEDTIVFKTDGTAVWRK